MNIGATLSILAVGLTLSAEKCSGPASSSDHGTAPTAGKWTLQTLAGNPLVLPPDAMAPYLQLDSTLQHISGFGGCNRLMGGLSIKGDSISFPMMGSTKMYCEATHALESDFLKALGNTTTFSLKDDRLTLFGHGQEQAVLRAESK